MPIDKVMEQNAKLLDDNRDLRTEVRNLKGQNLLLITEVDSLKKDLDKLEFKNGILKMDLNKLQEKELNKEREKRDFDILVAAKVIFIKDVAAGLATLGFYNQCAPELITKRAIEIFESLLKEFGMTEEDIAFILKEKIKKESHASFFGLNLF